MMEKCSASSAAGVEESSRRSWDGGHCVHGAQDADGLMTDTEMLSYKQFRVFDLTRSRLIQLMDFRVWFATFHRI
jgi:hypothetical protein